MECICGGKLNLKLTDKSYRFNGKEILVTDVPLYCCEKCDEKYVDFITDNQVERLAYKIMVNGLDKIQYTINDKDEDEIKAIIEG